MHICGGYKNRYFCQVTFAEDDVAVLKNPTGLRSRQLAVTQFGSPDYTADEVVDLEAILKAARTYAEKGELDESLPFER